jgi:hypothetical protein
LRYGWRREKHTPNIFIWDMDGGEENIYQTFSFEIWMEERKAYTNIFIWNLWNYITDYILENPILSLHISDTYVSVRKPMNGH